MQKPEVQTGLAVWGIARYVLFAVGLWYSYLAVRQKL